MAATVVSAVSVLSASAWPNWLTDNFDSYADQTAFDSVWANSGAPMTLVQDQVVSSPNAIYQGTVAQQSRLYLGTEVQVDDLDFSFKFYDPAGTASLARTYAMVYARAGAGDWAGGLEQIVALGKYNNVATTKYSARVAFSGPNWFTLDAGPDRSEGWHDARIVGNLIDPATVQYDFYIDSILSGSGQSTVLATFDWVVMGSGLSSSHGMWYDDIVVSVPEPSTIALSVLGGMGLLWIMRRRTA